MKRCSTHWRNKDRLNLQNEGHGWAKIFSRNWVCYIKTRDTNASEKICIRTLFWNWFRKCKTNSNSYLTTTTVWLQSRVKWLYQLRNSKKWSSSWSRCLSKINIKVTLLYYDQDGHLIWCAKLESIPSTTKKETHGGSFKIVGYIKTCSRGPVIPYTR